MLLVLLEFDERYGVVTENAVQCASLTALHRLCLALAQDTKINVNNPEREVVVVWGNGGGGFTPTLDKVGVDVNEMVCRSRLDAICG